MVVVDVGASYREKAKGAQTGMDKKSVEYSLERYKERMMVQEQIKVVDILMVFKEPEMDLGDGQTK